MLVIGSNLRMEVPIVAHWIRKAARKGASVAFVNPEPYEYYFKTAANVGAPLEQFVRAACRHRRPRRRPANGRSRGT